MSQPESEAEQFLAQHPRMIGVLFMLLVLLTKWGRRRHRRDPSISVREKINVELVAPQERIVEQYWEFITLAELAERVFPNRHLF